MNATKLRNGMRLIASAAALVLSVGGPAALASVDVTGANGTTGPGSENTNTYDVVGDVEVTVDNVGDVTNDVEVDFDAGNNNVNTNTTVEDITTGDVEISGSFDSEVNSDSMDIDLSGSSASVDADFSNDTTGPDSTNTNDLTVTNDTVVDITNDATIDNAFDLDVNTGNNTVRNNTTVGDVTTGDIDVDIESENVANSSTSNLDLSDLMGDNDVDASFENDTTGPDSLNENTVTVDNELDVTVNNTGTVDNTIDVIGDSGNNTVRRNTTVGDVTTGSISVNFDTTNQVN